MRSAVLGSIALTLASGCSKQAERPAAKLELFAAPPGVDVAQHVSAAVTKAKTDGKQLVVYVGAAWCEPCRFFHHAVERGDLDAAFADLRLVEFDLDRDGPALARAGYHSELIPLFAIPKADGRASGKAIEGSIKGDQAVAQIAPRLRALVANEQ